MEKFLTAVSKTDVNEEDIKCLCEEIFNKQIRVPIKDLHVIQLQGRFHPELYQSESGCSTLVINDLLIMFTT